jgi:hypothetical protein
MARLPGFVIAGQPQHVIIPKQIRCQNTINGKGGAEIESQKVTKIMYDFNRV